jgi:hypothetical protein
MNAGLANHILPEKVSEDAAIVIAITHSASTAEH